MIEKNKDYLYNLIFQKQVNIFLLANCDTKESYNSIMVSPQRRLTQDEFVKLKKEIYNYAF